MRLRVSSIRERSLLARRNYGPDAVCQQPHVDGLPGRERHKRVSRCPFMRYQCPDLVLRVVLHVSHRAKIWNSRPRPESSLGFFPFDGNIVGGLCVGIGMGSTGACPGTALVQAGSGLASGLAVAIGGIAGALVFLNVQPTIKARAQNTNKTTAGTKGDPVRSSGSQKPLDIPSALDVRPVTLLLLWVPLCLGAVALAGWFDVHRIAGRPISPQAVYGGPLIGLAQAATILFAGHPVGVSTMYEDVARVIKGFFADEGKETKESKLPPLLTASVGFSAGILLSAALLKPSLPIAGAAQTASIYSSAYLARQACGGAIMVFGARLAGGKRDILKSRPALIADFEQVVLLVTASAVYRRCPSRAWRLRPLSLLEAS